MKKFDTLYLDFDGCIVNTCEAITSLYNEDFRLYKDFQKVEWSDIDTWEFEELKLVPYEYINMYFNQPRFFKTLQFMPWGELVIRTLNKFYNIKIVSMGEQPNLNGKKKWIEYHLPFAKFIGIDFKNFENKAAIDMSDGILIDDNSEYLRNNNAKEKACFGDVYQWNEDWVGLRLANWMDVKDYLIGDETNENTHF